MGDHSKDNLVRALPAAAEHQAALKRVFGTKQAKARYPDKRAVALLDRWRCYCFSEVSSTMNIAAQLTRNHVPEEIRLGFIAGTGGASAEEALVVARCQKAGRGRDGRCWHSPAASGVYASFLLFPPESSRCEAGYSLALGVGICRVLGRFGLCCGLKWPNDVWAPGVIEGARCKLAGVLLESSIRGENLASLRAGVGINVNNTDFPIDVPGVSMRQILGQTFEPAEVLAELAVEAAEVNAVFFDQGFGAFSAEYAVYSVLEGKRVFVRENLHASFRRCAVVCGVNSAGELLVEWEDKPGDVCALRAGEVELADAVCN